MLLWTLRLLEISIQTDQSIIQSLVNERVGQSIEAQVSLQVEGVNIAYFKGIIDVSSRGLKLVSLDREQNLTCILYGMHERHKMFHLLSQELKVDYQSLDSNETLSLCIHRIEEQKANHCFDKDLTLITMKMMKIHFTFRCQTQWQTS